MNERKAPSHLRPTTKAWFNRVAARFDLEDHQVRLLTLAGESWDRCCQAREALRKFGLTYTDRFGAPRSRPELAVERDSRIAFARLVRELGFDNVEPPAETGMAPSRGNSKRWRVPAI
jgi:phage terminase small subunit